MQARWSPEGPTFVQDHHSGASGPLLRSTWAVIRASTKALEKATSLTPAPFPVGIPGLPGAHLTFPSVASQEALIWLQGPRPTFPPVLPDLPPSSGQVTV